MGEICSLVRFVFVNIQYIEGGINGKTCVKFLKFDASLTVNLSCFSLFLPKIQNRKSKNQNQRKNCHRG